MPERLRKKVRRIPIKTAGVALSTRSNSEMPLVSNSFSLLEDRTFQRLGVPLICALGGSEVGGRTQEFTHGSLFYVDAPLFGDVLCSHKRRSRFGVMVGTRTQYPRLLISRH